MRQKWRSFESKESHTKIAKRPGYRFGKSTTDMQTTGSSRAWFDDWRSCEDGPGNCHAGVRRQVRLNAEFADLGAKEARESEKVAGGLVIELALGEFAFDLLEMFGQAGKLMFVRGQELFLESFDLEGTEGAQFLKMLAIPIHEGALGDINGDGDAGEAPSLGPEFEETAFGIGRVHINCSRLLIQFVARRSAAQAYKRARTGSYST